MTDEQIKHMVNRFLGWRLPKDFHPDGGIIFKAAHNEGTPYEAKHQPSGTNLLNATQAEAMIRYLVEGLVSPASEIERLREIVDCGCHGGQVSTGWEQYGPCPDCTPLRKMDADARQA